MWLVNGTTLQLEFFPSPEDVPYAILSHTWGKDEVTFQDMVDLSVARQKLGWSKIEKTCEIAGKDGYRYTWIDTCCINKSSSAELSEAVNSMFLWYRKASTCYAYLSDLPAAPPNDDSDEWKNDEHLKEYLGKCRWFSRGWTLQELIAAKNILFYNGSWEFVASKRFLEPILAEITGVDALVLEDNDILPEVPVGKKISWASQRQTTRVEDMAYCLLGILDVNMPPLYGEGNKAFIRLQEELAKASNDLTLFAWRQSSVDSLIYQFRGIFAHSPAEFQCCADLRTQPANFDVDGEFTLTNRGLRAEQNLFVPEAWPDQDERPERLVLSLDCMECSDRTSGQRKWVGIYLRRFGAIWLRELPDTFLYFDSWSESKKPCLRPGGEREVAYISRTLTHNNIRDLQGRATVSVIYYNKVPREAGTSDAPWSVSIPYIIHAPRNHVGFFEFPERLCPMTKVAAPFLAYGFQGQLNKLWCTPLSGNEPPIFGADSQDHLVKSQAIRAYLFERYSDSAGRLDTSLMPASINIRDGPADFPQYCFSVTIDNTTVPSRDVSQASTRAGQNVAYSAGLSVISFTCELARDESEERPDEHFSLRTNHSQIRSS